MSMIAMLQQTDAIALQLDRIASMMVILAIAAVIVGILSAIALVSSLITMRSASKLLRSVEQQMARLGPKTEPLIEKMTRLTDDARGVTDIVRRRVNDLMDTVSDVNKGLREAHEAAEVRVREFGAVLDVIKAETEEVLLDGAATARGLHATAEALRGAAMPRGGRGTPGGAARAADEYDDDVDDDYDDYEDDDFDDDDYDDIEDEFDDDGIDEDEIEADDLLADDRGVRGEARASADPDGAPVITGGRRGGQKRRPTG